MKTDIFLKTIPKTLNWLALFTSLSLLFKVFYLNDFTEPIEGMFQLGLVIEGVMASVLASYVFYLIVIHFKETKDRAAIYPHIMRWGRSVVGYCQGQLTEFTKHTNHQTTLQTIQLQDIEDMFKKINPFSDAPLTFLPQKKANWIQYFEYHNNRSKEVISKIMSQLIFLEAPLIAHLTEIEDSAHFSAVEVLVNLPLNNNDLSAFASAFYKYCEACRALDVYLTQNIQVNAYAQ